MIPHSCGQKCGKLLMPSCGHECLLLCHPGPCPPCPKTVKTKCHCGRSGPLTQRCSKKNWSCGSVCGKLLACGHHKCSSPCHAGVCPSCSEKSIQSCICSRNRDLRDCADPVWKCNEVCCAGLFMLASTDMSYEIIFYDVGESFFPLKYLGLYIFTLDL